MLTTTENRKAADRILNALRDLTPYEERTGCEDPQPERRPERRDQGA